MATSEKKGSLGVASSVSGREKEILAFWEKDKTFEKSLEKTKKGKPYIFYDGPPFATGLPHYGHILASVIKDVIPRFWTMKGRYVARRWGWDCHGLPIENIAEKELGINSKDEIEKMGVAKFNHFCRSKVLTYTQEWKKTVDRVARWVDFDNSYKTMDNEYIESVWWAFKSLYDKGLIYRGEKILMYCPRCSTPLAKSEIAMDNSYKTVKDNTLVVKFKLKDEDVYALAWTTTPWTLPSNLALAVHPDLDYVYVNDSRDGTNYLLAKSLLGKFFKHEEEYTIVNEVKGRELEEVEYEPLFPYFKGHKNSFKFVLGEFVTAEDGTGIVHTAPAFGEDDYAVCKKYGIPMVQPVDEKGRFTSEVRDFSGDYIHDTNEKIIAFLKAQGKIVSVKKVNHEYPFCCRCDTKLMYRALPAWFVNIQKIKPRLLELNEQIHWIPEFLKEGRVKYTIDTAPDWNISRNRYWASAIPIWENEKGEHIVVGSIKELKKYAKNLKGDLDLHKDYLDKVVLEKNGVKYKRVPEVMDCWFESGSMTFAQFHYPFENKEYFEMHFPAQYVAEYIAQTRTWFYYMAVLSTALFDKIPFENVQTTGTILAKDGEKMSKSKGNFTDPNLIMEQYGSDALRFYLMSSPLMNADDVHFSDASVEEVYKKVLLLLYNVGNFYQLYASLGEPKDESNQVMDTWILSRLHHLISESGINYENYNMIKLCSEVRTFVDDLSTWYVRTSRDRFNDSDGGAKKTLRVVLEGLSKVVAPIMPFVSEIIWKAMGKKTSVHLEDWPMIDVKKFQDSLEKQMTLARDIVSVALKERDKAGISLKWPLSKVKVIAPLKGDLDEGILEVLKSELNVKEIEIGFGTAFSAELDTHLTPELEAEGYARELCRKIQAARKENGFKKEEEIELDIFGDIVDKVKMMGEFIKERVGAASLSFVGKLLETPLVIEGTIKDVKFVVRFSKK